MRTATLLATLLLASLAIPFALAGGGHGDEAPDDHAEEGATSPNLMPGESWTYNVTAEGTFDYHCHPHPWMLAQLRMLPANGTPVAHFINITEPEGEDFEAWTFSPQTLDVRVGDNVTWTNVGSTMHRVTQTVGEHIDHVGTLGDAEADVHADGEDHPHPGKMNPLWWLAVAAVVVGFLAFWAKGRKKA